jgi:NitT/TauT family transport system permease protein
MSAGEPLVGRGEVAYSSSPRQLSGAVTEVARPLADETAASLQEQRQPNAPIGTGPKHLRRRLGDLLASSLVLVAVVAVWEILNRTGAVSSYFLPRPWNAVDALWQGFVTGNAYRADFLTTVEEMLIGYAIGATVGLMFGTALAISPRVERAFLPYLVFIQTVPLVAVAPLLLIWFGFGLESKVVTVMLVVLFPVTRNTLAGLKATPQRRVDLLRALGASRWQVFKHAQLRAAAPYIFTGLDIGIVYSPVGAIVAEFLGGSKGLGIALFQDEQNLDVGGVFALLIVLGVLGIVLHMLVMAVRRRVVFWERFTNIEQ